MQAKEPNVRHKRSPLVISSVVLAVALGGCSGEPSSGDIEKAMKADIEKANEMFPGEMKAELHSVKKVSCVEAKRSAGYNCDVEIDVTAPILGRQKDVGQIRLVKGSDGWVTVE
jgi:hypothetical protein